MNRNRNLAITFLFSESNSELENHAGCSSKVEESDNDFTEKLSFILYSNSANSINPICRICHGGDSSGDLLTPCSCKGTMASVHLICLERWLKESNRDKCELCQYTFKLVREPKYGVLRSIYLYLIHPRERFNDLLVDLLELIVYTPAALGSTYMLLMLCEQLLKSKRIVNGSANLPSLVFGTLFGMMVIDFTYATWLLTCLQKHYENWREWYNNNSTVRLILENDESQKTNLSCIN